MNSVGINVSKGNIMVANLYPGGEAYFQAFWSPILNPKLDMNFDSASLRRSNRTTSLQLK